MNAAARSHTPVVTSSTIEMDAVDKIFDGTHALRGVTFRVRPGQVHALLGANGAGKSTLIKVLAGFYKPDAGSVRVFDDGHEVDAGRVAFIHQDLALVGDLTVAENVALVLGFPRVGRAIAWKRVRKQAVAALALVGGGIDPDARVSELSRADQSLVAIARAVSTRCCAIVLDEPTASLPDADVQRLFTIIADLAGRGVSVLYVTHRLDEVRRIADRVTILRDGSVVVDAEIDAITDAEIVAGIVGSAGVTAISRTATTNLVEVASLTNARVVPETGVFGFSLGRGEMLGLAGLRGAGHEEVGRAIAGIEPLTQGVIHVNGKKVALTSVGQAISHGIGFATSRREQEALGMTLSARENFFMNPTIVKGASRVVLSPRRERRESAQLASDVRLRPPMPEAVVANFSGGNQQKVVLGRWLSIDLSVLVLEEPTMGIDVGARAEIYGLIHALADQGLGVVVVSSDFEELATICDRVLVFDRGRIGAELRGADLTVDSLTHHASGATTKDPS
jgi:ribose transport system ATP-binding protein